MRKAKETNIVRKGLINVPIYDYLIEVSFVKDMYKGCLELTTRYDKLQRFNENVNDADGITIHDKTYLKNIFIIFNEEVSPGVIAHEADHATNTIFKNIGSTADVENDETHAYLLGYIVDGIFSIMQS